MVDRRGGWIKHSGHQHCETSSRFIQRPYGGAEHNWSCRRDVLVVPPVCESSVVARYRLTCCVLNVPVLYFMLVTCISIRVP